MEKNDREKNLPASSSVVKKKSSSVVRKKHDGGKKEVSSTVIKKVSKEPSSNLVNPLSTVVKRSKSSSKKNFDNSSSSLNNQKVVQSRVVVRKKINMDNKNKTYVSKNNNSKLEQNSLSDQEIIPKQKSEKIKKKDKKARKKKKNTKKKKILIIGLIILVLLLIVASYLFFFPFKLTYDTKGDLVTKTGTLDFEVTITGNKPISKIYYAIDPEDKDNLEYYEKLDYSSLLFQGKLSFDDFSVPVGSKTLFLYVKSFLGTHEIVSIPVEYTIGYIDSLTPNDVVESPIHEDNYIVNQELLLTFDESVSEEDVKKLVEKYSGTIVGEIYFLHQYQVEFDTDDLTKTKENLENEVGLVNVSYNFITELDVDYNKVGSNFTTNAKEDYYLDLLGIRDAFSMIKKPHWIDVGIIDTPIDYRHKDLNINKNNMIIPSSENGTYDEIDDILEYFNTYDHEHDTTYKTSPHDGCSYLSFRSHGTHVAGIIAGLEQGINSRAVLHYASLWSYYLQSDQDEKNKEIDGNFAYLNDLFSLTYSLSNMIMSDSRVINMSIGSTTYRPGSPGFEKENKNKSVEEIQVATEEYNREYQEYKNYLDAYFHVIEKTGKDFIIVKSAGNCNQAGDCITDADSDYFNRVLSENEFADKHSLIVGATDVTTSVFGNVLHSKASYSKYGEIVDILAPGTVYSTIYNNDYEWMNGTSQAAPIVSGIASLIYSVDSNFTSEQVIDFILNNTDGKIKYNSVTKEVIHAKKAVDAAIHYQETGEVLDNHDDTKYGFVQGTIQDALTKKPVQVVGNIQFVDVNDTNKIYTASDNSANYLNNGNYDYILPVGTYNMIIDFEGYIKETIYNIKVDENVVTYNILLNVVDDEHHFTVTQNGYAVDAFDGSYIPNTKIVFYKGVFNTNENKVAEVTTDSMGFYSVQLEPGNYTAYASADGYTSSKTNILVIPNSENQNCALTPVLKEGEIRAVLTWGLTPRDLDSHLVGPTPEGDQFHIYFGNKNYEYQGTKYNNLDLDDTTSYGPETTSVYVGVNGTYTYYVHDFSNRNSSSSNALSLSGAQVKLYIAGREEPIIYNVPNQPGTLWKVFSIENGQVTSINEMSFHSNYRNLE